MQRVPRDNDQDTITSSIRGVIIVGIPFPADAISQLMLLLRCHRRIQDCRTSNPANPLL